MSQLAGPGAPTLAQGEVLLVDIQHAAVLTMLTAPSRPPGAEVIRHLPTLGVEHEAARHHALVEQGDLDPGVARPARLVVTDRWVWIGERDGAAWQVQAGDLVDVAFSNSEPCIVFADQHQSRAVLVPHADAVHVQAAVAAALAASRAQPPTAGAEPITEPIAVLPEFRYDLTSISFDSAERPAVEQPARRRLRAVPGVPDRIFRTIARGGGVMVLAIMLLVGGFLLVDALPALRAVGFSFLTTSKWEPDSHQFGIAAVMTGTVLIALVALCVAVPLATGTALFISEVVPGRSKRLAIALVDLMAAVPSVIYGVWGKIVLQPQVAGVARWLATWFSWIPIFKVDGADPRDPLASGTTFTASTFIAGLVVAMMVIPITCSIMREVFSQAPAGEREGAYALGSSRWGMIRAVVLPFGKGGMIGAVMLGLGRAFGETVAVYLIISPVFKINFHILGVGSNSVASLIALRQGDATGFGRSALMAAGLALFVLTLVVNFTASTIVARSRSGSQSES